MARKETTTELIEHIKQLPANVEELVDFVIVGNEAIKSWKNKVRAIDKVNIANEAYKQSLHDGQCMGELVLLAEAKLGELLSNQVPLREPGGTFGNTLPSSINKKESHYAQEIYKHPNIMHQIIAETIDKNDIPTRHDVLKAIKENKREAKIEAQKQEIQQGLEQPDGLFDIIVIDPPWHFDGKYDAEGRRGTATYPQMSYEEIKNIKIPAKDDCILWLWTTHKDMWEAKKILEHWNFDYKGLIVWDKEKMGIGTWLRFQCEFCLLGIRGKPLWENKGLRDIIREPRTTHSRKPDIFYKMVEDNFVGRKLDYFYGGKREGWERYGTGENSISE